MKQNDSQAPARFWLLASQALYLFSLIPWYVLFALTFTFFEDYMPLGVIVGMALVWTYPLVSFLCSFLAWRFLKRQQTRLALILTFIPSGLILFFLIALFLGVSE